MGKDNHVKSNYGSKTTTMKTGHHSAAKFPDKSMGLKGPSVATSATRNVNAPTPKSLGPRKKGM